MKLITILDEKNNRCLATPSNMAKLNYATNSVAQRNADKFAKEIGQPVAVICSPINGRDIFYLTVPNYIG